jgi:hypothetical protein
MKFFKKAKDGGPKSTVTGYWLFEFKSLFSVALLRFDDGSRDEYHSHAFDSVNWVLRGRLREELPIDRKSIDYAPSWMPVVTHRNRFHRVVSRGTTWVLAFRGPWNDTWQEYDPKTNETYTLTHGRKVVR